MERSCGAGFPAAAAADLISASRSARSDRAARAIWDAPALAYDKAVARPIPFEAPVMKTALPERFERDGEMAG